jgi:hypothetical protein
MIVAKAGEPVLAGEPKVLTSTAPVAPPVESTTSKRNSQTEQPQLRHSST